MKKQIVSIFAYSILGLSAVMVSCGGDANKSKTADTEAVAAEMSFLRVDIDGMTCAVGCAKTIEKMLSETAGVSSAEVDYDKKAAFINYDKTKVTEAALLKSISEFKDGTYKAMASTKTCKSDCKKACCAVAAAKKTVKKVTKKVETSTNNAVKAATTTATKTINSTRGEINAVKKEIISTTGKTISTGKDIISKTNTKVSTKGAKIMTDTKAGAKKAISTTKQSAKTMSSKEIKNAKSLLGK